jgi:hypothetical protein
MIYLVETWRQLLPRSVREAQAKVVVPDNPFKTPEGWQAKEYCSKIRDLLFHDFYQALLFASRSEKLKVLQALFDCHRRLRLAFPKADLRKTLTSATGEWSPRYNLVWEVDDALKSLLRMVGISKAQRLTQVLLNRIYCVVRFPAWRPLKRMKK